MTEEKEVWKDIAGYEGLYQISSLGNVKSLNYNRTKKERILTPGKRGSGYLFVCLCKVGKSKKFNIHRLVGDAFIENPKNFPQVNHIDEDKTNNCVDNLEWCTAKYNMNFGTRGARDLETKKLRNRKNAEKSVLQFTKDGKFVNEYHSISEAERNTGIYQSNIVQCCKNRKRYKSAGGYIWKYKNND